MSYQSHPQPFQPSARQTHFRRSLWTIPGALALIFVAAVALWAELNDASERRAYQQTQVADASSVEAQLTGRKEFERAKLQGVASELTDQTGASETALQRIPGAVVGLERLWNRLVWIDVNNQVVARASKETRAQSNGSDALRIQSRGQTDHLVAPVLDADGNPRGQLLARYDLTDLLQSADLVWLTRRYEVHFISELGEVIATTANPTRVAAGLVYEAPLKGFKDTTLRLTPFEPLTSWRQNPRTLSLLAALLLLGAAASQLLRQEMQRVAKAVTTSQTEAAWRQSMEDSALVGLRARDLHGRILYANKTLCDMVGYSREELVGLLPPLPFWPPEGVDALMANNLSTLAGDAPAEGFETRWCHRDGHIINVMIFESSLVDPEGKQIGWMGSIVDISERKLLEEKERRHVEVMAQHARLNDMGLIASELAHELNQPLTAIVSYSAGLNVALTKHQLVDPDLVEAVNQVHRQATKAGDIVNWIRRQSSRSEPMRRACDINSIISDALAQRSRQFARSRVKLDVMLADGLPAMQVDRIGIEQVLTNLLRNAADALAEAEGIRQIRISSGLLSSAGEHAAAVQVVVSDNGFGLQGRTIDTLCSTFYSTKQGGMGLGLGICRSIAESHGGSLHVDEATGGGAEFHLILPVAASQTPTIQS